MLCFAYAIGDCDAYLKNYSVLIQDAAHRSLGRLPQRLAQQRQATPAYAKVRDAHDHVAVLRRHSAAPARRQRQLASSSGSTIGATTSRWCQRHLLRDITGLGSGALLAAVRVHAACRGSSHGQHDHAADRHVLDCAGNAALGASGSLTVGRLASRGTVGLRRTVLGRGKRGSRRVAFAGHAVGAVQNGLRLGGQLPAAGGRQRRFRSTSQFVDQVWSHTPLKMPAAMVRASQPMVTEEVHVPANEVRDADGVPRSMVTVEPSKLTPDPHTLLMVITLS